MSTAAELLQRINLAETYTELAAALWDLHNVPHTAAETQEALALARRTRKRLADKDRAYLDVRHEFLATFSGFGGKLEPRRPGQRWGAERLQRMRHMREALFMSDQAIADASGCSRARVIQLIGTKVEARLAQGLSVDVDGSHV